MSSMGGYGAAVAALGGILQSVAAEQAQEKANQVFQDMMMRQQHLGQQSYEAWQNNLKGMGVETARQQIAQGSVDRQKLYGELQGSASSATGPGLSARDSAFGQSSGQVRGQLGGYSDWELLQHLSSIRTQNELNKISNFSRGWASVLPLQLQDAQHSQDELAFWGNLLSSVGGGAASFGNTYNAGQPASDPYAPRQTGSSWDNPDMSSFAPSGGDQSLSPYNILGE